VADIFISYTSADREWAAWIGHELEVLGHIAHIHEWEISGGGDILQWMEQRLAAADHALCVVSAAYLPAIYSSWERRAAQWAAVTNRPNFMLPVFIEPCEAPPFLALLKRCDLHGIDEVEARERLKTFTEPAKKPPRGAFPGVARPVGAPASPDSRPTFPGKRKPRNLPYVSIGTLLKGREAVLERLHDALARSQDGRAIALHGLGGVGKTRLAVEYAWQHEAEHVALLFVSAETPERLGSGLAALAGQEILDLLEKGAHEDAAKIAAVTRWLEANPGWLLILDNVDDETAATAVEALVSRLPGGQVLVTGRAGDFSKAIEAFAVDVLSETDAASLLLDSTKKRETAPNDDVLAHELARELDGLALALAQASAYIDKQRTSFARYLKLWRETRETVLRWFDKRLVGTNRDIGLAATWATSVEKLTPEGRRLLEICAFLDPAPIPKFLLDVPVQAITDAHDALADLYAYSLASPADISDGKAVSAGFTVHRLVQDFTRSGMTEEQQRAVLQEALGWVDDAFVGDPQDVRAWPVLGPLAPHALNLAHHADEEGIAEPTARLYSDLGILYSAKALHAEEEPRYHRAMAIVEARYRPNDPEVARELNNLATLLDTTNRLVDAEPLMRRALAITEASYGPDHPKVAVGLNNLALLLLKATNRSVEAAPLLRRALAIDEASYGPYHPNVAKDLNNLVGLLYDTNHFAEAEPLMRRKLAITEVSCGPDHPEVAASLNYLARLLQEMNLLAEAEPFYRRSLAIFEASCGPDHPNVANVLNNLATLLVDSNRLVEAEPLLQRAMRIGMLSGMSLHPDLAHYVYNFALVLQATNRLAEAVPLMRHALMIAEASLGPDHPMAQSIRANLANLTRQPTPPGRVGGAFRSFLAKVGFPPRRKDHDQ